MEARYEYRGTEPFSNKRKRALPRSGCVPAMPDMRCTSSVATLVAPASSSPSRQRRYSQPLLTLRLRFGIISLRKELADALLEWKEYQEDAVKVFKSVPDFCFMKKDWINSGIPLIDGAGRHCDFHSLRKTFCTLMEKSGVPQRIAQEAMRHSDPSLTARFILIRHNLIWNQP